MQVCLDLEPGLQKVTHLFPQLKGGPLCLVYGADFPFMVKAATADIYETASCLAVLLILWLQQFLDHWQKVLKTF